MRCSTMSATGAAPRAAHSHALTRSATPVEEEPMPRSILLTIAALTLSWHAAVAQRGVEPRVTRADHDVLPAATGDTANRSESAAVLPDQEAIESAGVQAPEAMAPKKK